MKPNLLPILLLLTALTAGCMSTDDQAAPETLLGTRKQKALLAKARALQEFGFTPSFPYGNGMPYFGATLLEPNQAATKTFEADGLPIVQLLGDSSSKQLTVLIDTSANASWIQYPGAKENKVVFLKNNGQAIPYLGTSGIKGANAYAGVVKLLRIDGVTLNNIPFYVRMATGTMQPVVYSGSAPRVDAVLGYDNLRQLEYIQFDLRKGTVRFSTSQPYEPDEELLIGQAGISADCRDCLAVQGAVGGQPAPIVLDFCGDYGFARGDTREPTTKQVDLGEVVFLDVPTDVLASQDRFPRAGRRMLAQYTVTICPRQSMVYFERPEL